MSNPRLRHLPSSPEHEPRPPRRPLVGQTNEAFNHDMAKFSEWARKRLGDDWVFDSPQVSPARIIQEASSAPYTAAVMCQSACIILGQGHHARVRDYMIAAYIVALALRGNELHTSFVASKVKDGRSNAEGIPVEKFKDDIIHYLFVFIFHQSSMINRNRAWQWADSLHAYFEENRDPAEVERALRIYGQDKLRVVANKAKNLREAGKQAEQVDSPLSRHIDFLLDEEVSNQPDVPPSEEKAEEITDFGPRVVPPPEHTADDGSGGNDALLAPEDEDEETGHEKEEEGGGVSSGEDDTDSVGSIDGNVIIDRLENILLGTMSLGTRLTERGLGAEQQKQLLPMVVLLSVEIVELQRMIRGV